MNIEIKYIKFYKQLSKETLCFTASIYLDGKWFGTCENTGEGGMTTYSIRNYFDKEAKAKLAEIEDHFRQMPDMVVQIPKEIDPQENTFKVKMSFTEFIDMQIDAAWQAKEEKRLRDTEERQRQRLLKKQAI